MTSRTIPIPAREVRPGDVLFGMTVHEVRPARIYTGLWFMRFTNDERLWLSPEDRVTVERPVPSDPIGTVRAVFNSGVPSSSFTKIAEDEWLPSIGWGGSSASDAEVTDFPILWKPGMPIPTEGGQA